MYISFSLTKDMYVCVFTYTHKSERGIKVIEKIKMDLLEPRVGYLRGRTLFIVLITFRNYYDVNMS